MMALMDLKELNKFTLAGVIDVLKSLGCDDIATSLHNDSQQRSTNNDSVEQSLPVHLSPRSSFEPVTSLASCGRNSAFLSEGMQTPFWSYIMQDCVPFTSVVSNII